MRPLLLALSSLLFMSPARGAAAPSRPERPNVLFIVVDDLNDWTGYMGGHPQAQTPHLDRLAAGGVAFMQAHCASPVCVPSRTAVLTGRLPHLSKITNNRGKFRSTMPTVQTLPQRFREAGYLVRSAGKVFHYDDPPSWDSTYPSSGAHQSDNTRPGDANLSLKGLTFGPTAGDERLLADHITSKWVCDQLAKPSEQPFFLACGLHKPHLPWSVPERFFERFPLESIQLPKILAGDLNDMPATGKKRARSILHKQLLTQDKWRAAVQAYLASVAYIDERIGTILDALAAGPNAKNTLVVVWSDHGMAMGEKGHWKKAGLWEDITRSPLIFSGPGIPVGIRNEHAVGLIDLYKTTTELCGLDAPEQTAGYSLVPMLQDPTLARPQPVLTTINNEHTIRSDHWRLIRYSDGSQELYDHRNDPHEWHNLAMLPEHAARLEELGAWMPQATVKASKLKMRAE